MKWEKTGRLVCGNGESITIYLSDNRRWKIESRKERIPHAASKLYGGYWYHTTYYLIHENNYQNERSFNRLCDAKEAAEKLDNFDGLQDALDALNLLYEDV